MPLAHIVVNRDMHNLVHYFKSSERSDFAPSMPQSKMTLATWWGALRLLLNGIFGLEKVWTVTDKVSKVESDFPKNKK